MKRLLLAGAGALALAGCGGGTNSTVTANSIDSNQVVATDNVVGTSADTSPVSVETATPDASVTPSTSSTDSTDGNIPAIR